MNKGCPNCAKWVTPDVECERYHIKFYGVDCFEAHRKKKKGQASLGESYRKYFNCCREYKVDRKKEAQVLSCRLPKL